MTTINLKNTDFDVRVFLKFLFGWTTHYQFPEKKTVLEKIKRLKDEYENFDVW